MKRLAFLGGAAGLGLVAILGIHHHSQAADHGDAPGVAGVPPGNPANSKPMADINDVYAWMTTDGANVNLALTVSPFDNLAQGTAAERHFGPTVVYAIHISSHPGFGMPGTEKKIICSFTDDTHGKCWLSDSANKTIDYVAGDLSGPNGRISASNKFRVFAGRRSDPFFFNLGGVKNAISTAESAAACNGACPGSVPVDAAGCMKIGKATGDFLRSTMSTKPASNVASTPCDDTVDIDCFVGANVMAIVVQVDKTELLNGSDKLVSVWASTHAGS